MSIKKIKTDARELIRSKEFNKAKTLIDSARRTAPDDLTVLEVLDYWYNTTNTMSSVDKLSGSLNTIEKMLEIRPSGDAVGFDEADYDPSLFHVRASIMNALVQETFDLALLEKLLSDYEKLFNKPGFTFHLMDERDSVFEIVAKELGATAMKKSFGDIRLIRKKFGEQRKLVNDPRACRILADQAVKNKDFATAAENYRRVRPSDPKNRFIIQLIAVCEIEQGKFEEALDVLSEVPKSYKFLPEKEYIAAQALAELGRPKDALKKLRAYNLSEKEVGKKGTAARDIHFRSLWYNPEFEKMISAPNLITTNIQKDREEALKRLTIGKGSPKVI